MQFERVVYEERFGEKIFLTVYYAILRAMGDLKLSVAVERIAQVFPLDPSTL